MKHAEDIYRNQTFLAFVLLILSAVIGLSPRDVIMPNRPVVSAVMVPVSPCQSVSGLPDKEVCAPPRQISAASAALRMAAILLP
jgi:hypothetical protein